MRRWTLTVCAALALAAPARTQELSAEERKEGFRPLFDGKDFAGLRFSGGKAKTPPKNWSVADGMIHLSGGGAPHLATEWDYDDFDVRFRWKALRKGYNSGFFVRSGRNVGANQINLAQKACGNLMGGAKGGKAVPELQKEPGEWNEWRVLAVGDSLTFWCNGSKAWTVTGFKTRRGYLGWQAEGAAIDFKDLRIKELGFEPVHFGKAQGWRDQGSTRIADAGAAPLVSDGKADDFVLRLEYRSGSKAALKLPGRAAELSLTDEKLSKLAHPEGRWNFLEVNAVGGKAKLWLNGTMLAGPDLPGSEATALVIAPSGEAAIQNVRIRRVRK